MPDFRAGPLCRIQSSCAPSAPHPKPCANKRNHIASFPSLRPFRFVCGSDFDPCFFRRKKTFISKMAAVFASTCETGPHIRNMHDFSFVERTLKSLNVFSLLFFRCVSFVERRENGLRRDSRFVCGKSGKTKSARFPRPAGTDLLLRLKCRHDIKNDSQQRESLLLTWLYRFLSIPLSKISSAHP